MSIFAPGAQGSTFTLALAGIVVRALTRTITALKNRRQVAELSALSDRSLKDIGLVRSDVHAALAVPIFHDPSLHLIDVAGGKRRQPVFTSQPTEPGVAVQPLNRLRCADAALKQPLAAA
jgi:uncharacterized protein YjiS (DUF1127 family)